MAVEPKEEYLADELRGSPKVGCGSPVAKIKHFRDDNKSKFLIGKEGSLDAYQVIILQVKTTLLQKFLNASRGFGKALIGAPFENNKLVGTEKRQRQKDCYCVLYFH